MRKWLGKFPPHHSVTANGSASARPRLSCPHPKQTPRPRECAGPIRPLLPVWPPHLSPWPARCLQKHRICPLSSRQRVWGLITDSALLEPQGAVPFLAGGPPPSAFTTQPPSCHLALDLCPRPGLDRIAARRRPHTSVSRFSAARVFVSALRGALRGAPLETLQACGTGRVFTTTGLLGPFSHLPWA